MKRIVTMMLVFFIAILQATAKVTHQSNTVVGNMLYEYYAIIFTTSSLLLLTALI
jgi:NADH:ubiquinone oxidoreductase subunit 6 (subunit J)